MKLPDCMGYRVWSTLRTCVRDGKRLSQEPHSFPTFTMFMKFPTFTMFIKFTMFMKTLHAVRNDFFLLCGQFYFHDELFRHTVRLRNLTWGLQHAEWSLLLYQLDKEKCHQCVILFVVVVGFELFPFGRCWQQRAEPSTKWEGWGWKNRNFPGLCSLMLWRLRSELEQAEVAAQVGPHWSVMVDVGCGSFVIAGPSVEGCLCSECHRDHPPLGCRKKSAVNTLLQGGRESHTNLFPVLSCFLFFLYFHGN